MHHQSVLSLNHLDFTVISILVTLRFMLAVLQIGNTKLTKVAIYNVYITNQYYHWIIGTSESSLYQYTQIYVSISSRSAIASLQKCISSVMNWMTQKRLKRNAEKTELILIGTKLQCQRLSQWSPIDIIIRSTNCSNWIGQKFWEFRSMFQRSVSLLSIIYSRLFSHQGTVRQTNLSSTCRCHG